MRINIIPSDPTWTASFLAIKSSLLTILSDIPVTSIEHVGSTSVPGLAAKPIIDIDIIIPPQHFPATCHALARNGYTYNPEPGGQDRMSFRYNAHLPHDAGAVLPTEDGEPRRAVYVNMVDGQSLRNHLGVRKVLRSDPELREEYGRVKLELARREFESIGKYGAAKSEVLSRILARAEEMSEDVWAEIYRFDGS